LVAEPDDDPVAVGVEQIIFALRRILIRHAEGFNLFFEVVLRLGLVRGDLEMG
jgi:hypothetical protein